MSNLNSEDLDRLLKKERKDVYNKILRKLTKISNHFGETGCKDYQTATDTCWSQVTEMYQEEVGDGENG